jgi:vancomycin resistance protein YoaR
MYNKSIIMSISHAKKITYYCILTISIVLFLAVIFIVAFEIAYAYKIYPRTYVNGINITSKTKSQAIEYLTAKTDPLIVNGLEFVFEDANVNIDAVITGPTVGDVYEEIFSYDVRQTVNQAYDYGRGDDWGTRFKQQLKAIFKKNVVPLQFNFNKEGLETILRNNFIGLEQPAVDAALDIAIVNGIAIVNITEEVAGQTFDYQKAVEQAEDNIINLKQEAIVLQTIVDEPSIKKSDAEEIVAEVKEILDLAPITFTYGDEEWELTKPELALWLKLEKQDGKIKLTINQEEAEKFLSATAVDIDIEALDAKFEIIDGRVTQFQSSRPGLKLNIEKTIEKVKNKLLKEKINIIAMLVDESEPQVQNSDVNDLGIVELIGRGISDFSGSPKNRIHNIINGANSLNGLLIKPDETFSLLEALGEINADNGYLPELVIKGNKTIPEYGGGLCQIGTTTFRTALQSGLPIVERRNHSYNVSYYAPTGTDATIYGPHPDMRFTNNTGKHILFLTKVETPKLIFEFWGTKDGREVKFIGKEETNDFTELTPVVYNIVRPGAPKYIETTELEPGKKKKLESSHTGADAKFDYIVSYPDGTVAEETFTSHYIPWREVWLIGVEPSKEAEDKNEATNEN